MLGRWLLPALLALLPAAAEARGANALARETAQARAQARAVSQALVLANDRREAARSEVAEIRRRLAEADLNESAARRALDAAHAKRDRALGRLSRLAAHPSGALRDDAARLAAAALSRAKQAGRQAERLKSEALAARPTLAAQAAALAAAEAELARETRELEALYAARSAQAERAAARLVAAERAARARAARARNPGDLARPARPAREAARPAKPQTRRAPASVAPLGEEGGALIYGVSAGAVVTAPADGVVAFAGPFRGYGEVLILEAERDYALLLMGLGSTSVRIGARVLAGEPVGEMGRDGASQLLRFEVRRNGARFDASEWLGVELRPKTAAMRAALSTPRRGGSERE